MIEGHGDDLYCYGDKIRHNFSTNICQKVDHSALLKHLAGRLHVIANYPEPAPFGLEQDLAVILGIPAHCIMVTNGAVDAIYLAAQAFAGKRSAVLQPTFSEYADACRINGHAITGFHDLQHIPADAEVVWLCNPNNPTGEVHDADTLRKLLNTHTDKTFIIDQSYHAYTRREVLSHREATAFPNLILLYSLTKDYCIPGLRLGYALACPETVEGLKRHRVPWSVNAPAIEAARFLFRNPPAGIDKELLLSEAARIARAFRALGIEVYPSATNYLLCRLPRRTAAELKGHLVEKAGILIRDASNFEGLDEGCFRVAAQLPEENDLLINEVVRWMNL